MMEPEITIEIPLNGQIKLSVKGVKGSACKDFSKDIEKALGKTVSSKPTAEMKEGTHNANRNINQR